MISGSDELRAQQVDERVGLQVRSVRRTMGAQPVQRCVPLARADGEIAVARRSGHDFGSGPETFMKRGRGRHEEGVTASRFKQQNIRVRQPEMMPNQREIRLPARKNQAHVQVADAPRRELGDVETVAVEALRERGRDCGRAGARRAVVHDAAWLAWYGDIGCCLVGRSQVALYEDGG